MAEREKPKQPNAEPEAQNEHAVTVHGSYLGKITLPKNATLADLIEEVKKQVGAKFNLRDYTIMLNDRDIELDGKGNLKENPVLTENATLSLLKKFTGGN